MSAAAPANDPGQRLTRPAVGRADAFIGRAPVSPRPCVNIGEFARAGGRSKSW